MYHRYESDYVSHHMHKRSNHQQSSLVPIPYTALCMSTRCHKAKGACASFAATNYMPDIHTKPFAYTLSNVWCITAFAFTLGMPGKRIKKVTVCMHGHDAFNWPIIDSTQIMRHSCTFVDAGAPWLPGGPVPCLLPVWCIPVLSGAIGTLVFWL